MDKIAEKMRNALLNFGAITEKYRIEVTEIEKIPNKSDYVYVHVMVWKPRSRKADIAWKLFVDTAREVTHFDRSEFYRLK